MISSVERYSSSAGKRRTNFFVGRLVRIVITALILYLLVTRALVSTYRIASVSMEPALSPADRVIVSELAFGPRVPFSAVRLPGLRLPQRGDLVVVQPPLMGEPNLAMRIFDPLVRFFTLQKVSLHRDLYGSRVPLSMVKRVIGIPGDTIRLKGFVASIRPRGASDFVPEQQLIRTRYVLQSKNRAPGWSDSLPFSGNEPEILLRDGEYFVLGDNRPDSSDSRSWGPVGTERIVGKVIYRYWPPVALGKL
jgi:signal peptidase I